MFSLRTLGLLAAGVVAVLGAAAILVGVQPTLAAQGADVLREWFGNEPVAQLEGVVLTARDGVSQHEYELGLEKPSAPWDNADVQSQSTLVPAPSASSTPSGSQSATVALPTATPTAPNLALVLAPRIEKLRGAGTWTPYLRNSLGENVARRTFLQPDPERPYALVAVVAIDLTLTRLHYALGSQEPSVPDGPKGSGKIAAEDRAGGSLLAAFNGGFKATHGRYGAMQNGVVALPALSGLGTVAIYDDGRVRIGEWGKDILPSKNIIAWRENARLIIQNGQISPRVDSNSVSDWGGTIDGKVVTWRSALGIDAEGRTLYYFAGSSLSMPALARAMLAVGVQQGLLLDINASWVHFTAIHQDAGTLSAEPLLTDMKSAVDRYLHTSPRDFFYITAR